MFETPRRRDEGGVLMFHQYRLAASLPPWGAKKKSRSKDLLFLFVSEFIFAVNHTCNHDGAREGGTHCGAD